VPKQLVGAVYDMDDHAALCRSAEGVSEVGAALALTEAFGIRCDARMNGHEPSRREPGS
jgi:hypothetical protein